MLKQTSKIVPALQLAEQTIIRWFECKKSGDYGKIEAIGWRGSIARKALVDELIPLFDAHSAAAVSRQKWSFHSEPCHCIGVSVMPSFEACSARPALPCR